MKVVGILTLIGLVGLFLVTGAIRYDLIVIQKPFWLLILGGLSLVGGAIAVACKVPAGAVFVTAGIASMAVGGAKTVWPNISVATSQAQTILDKKSAETIRAQIAPQRLPCDKNTQPRPKFFDQVTGEPLIWVGWNTSRTYLECYSGSGFHSLTQEALVAVDAKLALKIMAQEPESTPTPLPSPAATPTPLRISTPLPELGQGPIPPEWLNPATPTPTPLWQ